MNVSDVILKVLASNGVSELFGIPGDAINHVLDAVRRQESLRFIQVRHEEAGAFAASAQAKLTGKLSACMGTSGPGAVHLLNGLYDAHFDHAPVIAITGQVETRFIGTEYHQEVRTDRLFADVAVFSQTVMSEDQVPALVIEACRAAIARRGVAHIAIPSDIANRHTAYAEDQQCAAVLAGKVLPVDEDCDRAVAMINKADNIVILAGIGCADARRELLALAETLGAPIVRTLKAKEIIDDDHRMCIGGLGLLGGKPAIRAMQQCDLLIMAGTDFPYPDFYPKSADIIQVDNQPTQIGRRHPVSLGLIGEADAVLARLNERVDAKTDIDFLSACQDDVVAMVAHQRKLEQSDTYPIAPARVLAELSARAPDNAIFCCDTGTVTAWAARHLLLRQGQRFICSGGLASMAFGLPAAIGAQLSYPDAAVFALCGDGGFSMLVGDFVTAVKYNLPLVVVVLNNEKLAYIALEQEASGLPDYGNDLLNPDFAALARACGGEGITVQAADELAPALVQAMANRLPTVLDVQVDRDVLFMPPTIEPTQAIGFGVAKVKELFSR